MKFHKLFRIGLIISMFCTLGFSQSAYELERNDYLIAVGLFEDGLYQSTELRLREFIYKYPTSDWRESVYFLLGNTEFRLEKFSDSRVVLKEFLVQFPFSNLRDDAAFMIGETYYEEQNYTEAATSFGGFENKFPKSEFINRANYWAGESFFEIQDYASASLYYSNVIEADNNELKDYAYYSLGWTKLIQQHYDESTIAFQALADNYPDSPLLPDAKFKMGEAFWRKKDYQQVINTLELPFQSSIISPQYQAVGLYYLGDSYYEKDNMPKASNYFIKVINDYPESKFAAEAQLGLGWIYIKEKNFNAAISTFEDLKETNRPDEFQNQVQYLLGVSLKNAGFDERGNVEFEEIVDFSPESNFADNANFELGLYFFNDKNYESAYNYFSNIVANYQDSDTYLQAYKMCAECSIELQNYENAERYYSGLLEVADSDIDLARSLYRKGWSQFRQRKFPAALETFATFLERYPDHENNHLATYWSGEIHYEGNNYKDAITAYTNFLVKYTDSPKRLDAIYSRAYAKYALGDYAEARKDFSAVINQYPDSKYSSDAHYQVANCFYALKQFENAYPYYQKVIDRAPVSSQLHNKAKIQLARSNRNADNYEPATEIYRNLINQSPGSEFADDAIFELASIYSQQLNEFETAIINYKSLVNSYPQSTLVPTAYLEIGNAYYNLQKFDEAIQNYNVLLEEYPSSNKIGDAITGIQDSHLILGEIGQANQVVDNFIMEHPNNPFAAELLLKNGDSYLIKELPDKAITQYQLIISQFSNSSVNPNAYLGLADAFLVKGDQNNSVRYLKLLAQKYSNHELAANAQLKLGQLAFKGENYQEAESYFIAVIRDHPESAEALSALLETAVTQETLNKSNLATANYEKLIAQYPQTSYADRARNNLGRLITAERQGTDAINLHKTVISRRTDEFAAEAQYLIGWTYYMNASYEQAAENLLRVRYLYPQYDSWVASATIKAGECFEALDNDNEAQRLYELVIEQHPDGEYYAAAQAGLTRINAN